MSARALLPSLAALLLAALLVAVTLLLLGVSPTRAATGLLDGAFGSPLAITDTLVKATPLIFCGLAVALAFEGALWNIGADGQLIAGAVAAGGIGPRLASWPHPLAVSALLLVGALGGGAWGWIAGWLRARRNVSEVISTIMLNYSAAQILAWAVHGPLIEASRAFPESSAIAASARLQLYFAPSRLNLGMALAAVLSGLAYLYLYRSAWGFALRAIGRSPRAATFHGLATTRVIITTLVLSGALAGLGGAVQVTAITHRLYEAFSPGWGYEAIAVALVARLNPLAIVPSAIFFGALDNGAQAMQRAAGVSAVLVQVIEALVIIILLAFDSAAGRRLGRGLLSPATPDSAEVDA